MPSFGPDDARLLIVGLAPGLKGANRTGRPFLGDYAGELLYRTLLKVGLARGRHDVAAPEDARAGRLHDHQRGALRAAAEQADARRDCDLPPVPDRPHRRSAAISRSLLAIGRIAHDGDPRCACS